MSDTERDLLELERGFWLGDADYFRAHSDDTCLVAFPGIARTLSREELAGTVGATSRWADLRMDMKGTIEPSPDVAMLTYEAAATRDGEPYEALVSSGYVRRDGEWKLMFHAHAPVLKGA
jgi:hypothetical protein